MKNGELLKKARKKLGFSQQDLADYLKVDRPLVAHWESERRHIPKGVLKMAREVRRIKKRDALRRFKPQAPKTIMNISPSVKCAKTSRMDKNPIDCTCGKPSLTHSPLEICSQNTDSVTFSAFSLPKQENNAFLPPAKESTEYFILESYVDFKKRNKRFPMKADFLDNAVGDLSEQDVLKCFRNLNTVKTEAGKLRRIRMKEKTIKTFPSPSGKIETLLGDRGFPCPCCGRVWRGAKNFYAALRETIKTILFHTGQDSENYQAVVLRFMAFLFGTHEVKRLGYDVNKLEDRHTCFCGGNFKPDWHSSFKAITISGLLGLLQSADGQSPEEAISDCRKAIFGNQEDTRYKDKCDYCNQWRDKWTVTLDNSTWARFICEDCFA